jgi:hypothetical protein
MAGPLRQTRFWREGYLANDRILADYDDTRTLTTCLVGQASHTDDLPYNFRTSHDWSKNAFGNFPKKFIAGQLIAKG